MILILILLILSIVFILLMKKEQFNNNTSINTSINILDKEQLIDFLKKDQDNYYKSFNKLDMIARNINSISNYNNFIEKSCVNPTNKQINILEHLISKADKLISKYSCIGFNGKLCSDLKWNIGLIDGKKYEYGLPHTRNNIIIIPISIINNSNDFLKTLIHEKIHIYQKTYNNDIYLYINENGYKKYKTKDKLYSDQECNIRSNPDLNDWIYLDKNNNIMMTCYNNDHPSSIIDTKTQPINSSYYEHPYEYMAYNLANIIIG